MLERKQRKKWQMLGRFAYHHNKIEFVATDDEREYEVRIWNNSHHRLGTRSNPLKKPKRVKADDVHQFTELSPARTAFENAVQNLVLGTSYTDVSIFMQQQATARI